MDEHPLECYCCIPQPSRLDWTTACWYIFQAMQKSPSILRTVLSPSGHSPPAKADQRYIPARPADTNPSLTLPQHQSVTSSQSNCPNSNIDVGANVDNANMYESVALLYVVFGIKSMQGFHDIENIEVQPHPSDPLFFQELRTRHKNRRWWFQHFFSPYRFDIADSSSLRKFWKDTFPASVKHFQMIMVTPTSMNTTHGRRL
ncbi:hypothetical protein GQ44DRAFT_718722 [Phaeosphaeriaceae sp. PMI808]|nr:hypothetical protein GQ44DRAFT_718722 [Phaeosphaeriaceae sp. PMI808]